MKLTTDQLDRAHGVLAGAAVGDALGVPYEFGAAKIAPGAVPQMIGGGLGPYEPGEWSDDTQMAICIAEALTSDPGRAPSDLQDDIAYRFLAWESNGASDIGAQTLQVIRTARRALYRNTNLRPHTAFPAAAKTIHDVTGRSAGNGSLMRTAPVALRYLDDRDEMARAAAAISKLTHYDDVAAEACVIWCDLIRNAVLTGEMGYPDDALDLIPATHRGRWVSWVDEADACQPHDFTPNGYVVRAFQAAYCAAVNGMISSGDGFSDGVTAAVHAGDDTDTIAAIAGSLLGAICGQYQIPSYWLSQVHGWPSMSLGDLNNLTDQILDVSEVAS